MSETFLDGAPRRDLPRDAYRPERHLAATGAARELAGLLHAAGFTEDAAARALGAADPEELLSNMLLYAAYSAGAADALTATTAGVLIQLFARRGEVARERYADLVPDRLRRCLHDLALVAVGDDAVLPQVAISPYAGMYLLSDPLFATGADGRPSMCDVPDSVMPPHASTFLLLHAAERTGGRLLDLGTGCGALALVLGEAYASVTGVDVNPRAVAYARLNAEVNARPAVFALGDLRSGHLGGAGPADHLVFNSPTGPAPRTETGWMTADQALSAVTGHLPALVRPGGLAQVFLIACLTAEHPAVRDLVRALVPAHLDARIAELPATLLAVSAGALARSQVDPGCLLVTGEQDARLLVERLRSMGVREVRPAVVSVTRSG